MVDQVTGEQGQREDDQGREQDQDRAKQTCAPMLFYKGQDVLYPLP